MSPATTTLVAIGAHGSPFEACVAAIDATPQLTGLVVEHAPDLRKGLKTLRRRDDVAAVLAVVDADGLDGFLDFCRTLRKVMHETTLRVIACRSGNWPVADLDLIVEHGIDAIVDEGDCQADRFLALLGANLRTYRDFQDDRARRAVEQDLLTTLARFSRTELGVADCLAEFTRSIARISGAVLANAVAVRKDGRIERSRITYRAAGTNTDAADKLLAIDPTPDRPVVTRAAEGGCLAVSLDESPRFYRDLGELVGMPLAGSIAVPLKSFARTLCVVECFLPEGGLDGVSVDLVALIEKSSAQLGVLLERHEVETRLKRQYQRLKGTLAELSTTREALGQAEKLAAVGQLAAGIAHEINNPIAYVLSNFSPLDEYLECMSQLLDLHGRFVAAIDAHDDVQSRTLRSSLDDLGREIDIDFVLSDVRSLVSESRSGLLRVKDIVVNLNEFARKDSLEASPADLNHGLVSTLKIVAPQYKDGVVFECEYGELPEVPCHLGLLNQVFLNIVQNACQAMDGRGHLRINTCVAGDEVVIGFRDDGPGMPADVIEHVFDPFYTTKPVGQGTGLGLSVSHGIVQRHGGRIEIDSTPGHGTEFRVVLPLAGLTASADDSLAAAVA
ncbi:MAG: sensor histidine kinase [Gammaproteobacteria bacterium]